MPYRISTPDGLVHRTRYRQVVSHDNTACGKELLKMYRRDDKRSFAEQFYMTEDSPTCLLCAGLPYEIPLDSDLQ